MKNRVVCKSSAAVCLMTHKCNVAIVERGGARTQCTQDYANSYAVILGMTRLVRVRRHRNTLYIARAWQLRGFGRARTARMYTLVHIFLRQNTLYACRPVWHKGLMHRIVRMRYSDRR